MQGQSDLPTHDPCDRSFLVTVTTVLVTAALLAAGVLLSPAPAVWPLWKTTHADSPKGPDPAATRAVDSAVVPDATPKPAKALQ
jgi:hypothetical protein